MSSVAKLGWSASAAIALLLLAATDGLTGKFEGEGLELELSRKKYNFYILQGRNFLLE